MLARLASSAFRKLTGRPSAPAAAGSMSNGSIDRRDVIDPVPECHFPACMCAAKFEDDGTLAGWMCRTEITG